MLLFCFYFVFFQRKYNIKCGVFCVRGWVNGCVACRVLNTWYIYTIYIYNNRCMCAHTRDSCIVGGTNTLKCGDIKMLFKRKRKLYIWFTAASFNPYVPVIVKFMIIVCAACVYVCVCGWGVLHVYPNR